MEEECYDFELEECVDYPFDSFGGQTKAIAGFEKYNIEGAEFFHMGQMFVLGSYPIHFHKTLDVSDKGPVIRSNSIHDSFSRCITIHALRLFGKLLPLGLEAVLPFSCLFSTIRRD